MGWKGAIRSIQAAQRRSEREARRRQNELEGRRKQLAKMQELERAAFEVEEYENRIDLLTSVHKECGEVWNWESIYEKPAPSEPTPGNTHEQAARRRLDTFKPSVTDKLLKRTQSRIDNLAADLEKAQTLDRTEFEASLAAYRQEYQDWEDTRNLAGRILGRDIEAFTDAIREVDPFSEISALGSRIHFVIDHVSAVNVTFDVHGADIIPSEVKSLLQSGKLSVKKMPKGRFYEVYQDYVCGCVLRIARELFALLPIETTIVTAIGEVLNTQTGHIEQKPILSVLVPKATLAKLDFERLDPSDSLNNFVHRMKFKKTGGFEPVETISS
ncbi:MAG: hypothetical protein AB1791_04685 [Chloroflexota bacterium]